MPSANSQRQLSFEEAREFLGQVRANPPEWIRLRMKTDGWSVDQVLEVVAPNLLARANTGAARRRTSRRKPGQRTKTGNNGARPMLASARKAVIGTSQLSFLRLLDEHDAQTIEDLAPKAKAAGALAFAPGGEYNAGWPIALTLQRKGWVRFKKNGRNPTKLLITAAGREAKQLADQHRLTVVQSNGGRHN